MIRDLIRAELETAVDWMELPPPAAFSGLPVAAPQDEPAEAAPASAPGDSTLCQVQAAGSLAPRTRVQGLTG